MVAWLILAGVVLIPCAAFLLWNWRGCTKEVALMRGTETTPAGEVAKLPPGSLVEVKGRLRCTAPLTGELSKAPCAHFIATVEREYEIVEYDPKHKSSYRVHKTELVTSNAVFAAFEVEDESGRAIVMPEGASIEGIEAIDRYEAHGDAEYEARMPASVLGTAASKERTLGFRYKEMHLPLDAEIYVLGCTCESRGVAAPPEGAKDRRFIISINSEEARTAALGGRSKLMLGLGVFSVVGAVLCLGSALWLARHGLDHATLPPQQVLQSEGGW
jgi:hypothetical protein